MRQRIIKKGTKVLSATPSHQVVTYKRATDFTEGKIKTYLSELGIDVREYQLKASIRLTSRLIDKGLITIQ
jgi:hypothetical protein